MVEVQFATDGGEAYKKIFATDFDSIIYNLVINSIESFEETKISERQITIRVESDDDSLTVHYSDNGHGLTEAFKKNPYSIERRWRIGKKSWNRCCLVRVSRQLLTNVFLNWTPKLNEALMAVRLFQSPLSKGL